MAPDQLAIEMTNSSSTMQTSSSSTNDSGDSGDINSNSHGHWNENKNGSIIRVGASIYSVPVLVASRVATDISNSV